MANALALQPVSAPQLGRSRVDGEHFLLGQTLGHRDWVSRHCESEMDDLFTLAERVRLEAGETVNVKAARWTEMVAAARVHAAAG